MDRLSNEVVNKAVEVLQRLAVIETKQDVLLDKANDITKNVDDLEKRVGVLEAYKAKLVGMGIVIIAVVTFAINLALKAINKAIF